MIKPTIKKKKPESGSMRKKTWSQGRPIGRTICSAWFVNSVIPPAHAEAMPERPSRKKDVLTRRCGCRRNNRGTIAERKDARTANWAIVKDMFESILGYIGFLISTLYVQLIEVGLA